jgi:hypothetical protein
MAAGGYRRFDDAGWQSPSLLAASLATNFSREDVYYSLDGIADDLQLAELGLAGDAAACRQELSLLLSQYPREPFVDGWTNITFDVTC